jgi:TRAP-type C4-dicarboxylate transport system substrate-binding protein
MVYSAKEWAKLTAEEQAVVQKGALLARDEQRKLAPVKEEEAFKFLRDKGMVINDIDTTGFARNAVAIQDQIAAERKAVDLLAAIRAVK